MYAPFFKMQQLNYGDFCEFLLFVENNKYL